jgi:hypothetical protein
MLRGEFMRAAPGMNPFVFLKSFQGEAKSGEEHETREEGWQCKTQSTIYHARSLLSALAFNNRPRLFALHYVRTQVVDLPVLSSHLLLNAWRSEETKL